MENPNKEEISTHSKDSAVNKIRDLIFGSQEEIYDQHSQQLETKIIAECRTSMDEMSARLMVLEASIKSLEKSQQTQEREREERIKPLEQSIQQHLLDPQQRTIDTAEILADSIKLAAADKQHLVVALNEPVDECIRSIVSQKPQEFADSLFPVMGPAIRKSISETLKSFVQSTNQMIEQSMSPKSLRWRWEAKRSGIPFSEIVLKHSLLYRVEEVFLIQQGSGLLIEHVSHPDVVERDSDAVSAMLTVIRDFSRDSFSTEASDSLQTVEFGERTLWMFDGPKAILACVNRGLVPKTNRATLQSVLEQFHLLYSAELENFSGDRRQHPQFQTLLETCLTQQSKESENTQDNVSEKHSWMRSPLFWVLLGALLLSGYGLWNQYDEKRRTNALLAELKSINGVVVIGTEQSGETLLVKVLRDPLAPTLGSLVDKYGFTSDKLQLRTSLYQSLDPSLAAQRAAQFLDAPASVLFSAQDQQLVVTGTATQQWLDFAGKMRKRIPGFSSMNLDQLTVDDTSRLLQIRQQLQTPQTVQLRLDNDILFVSGTAPAIWIDTLKQNSALLQPVLRLVTDESGNQLQADEWLKAVSLQQELDGISFYFSKGISINAEQQIRMQNLLDKIDRLLALLDVLKVDVRFVVNGFVDGSGNLAHNQTLKIERAIFIKQQLLKSGIPESSISIAAGKVEVDNKQANVTLRRADVQIRLLSSNKSKSIFP